MGVSKVTQVQHDQNEIPSLAHSLNCFYITLLASAPKLGLSLKHPYPSSFTSTIYLPFHLHPCPQGRSNGGCGLLIAALQWLLLPSHTDRGQFKWVNMASPWLIWQKACHLHPEKEGSTSSVSLETILYPVHLCVFTHNLNTQNL